MQTSEKGKLSLQRLKWFALLRGNQKFTASFNKISAPVTYADGVARAGAKTVAGFDLDWNKLRALDPSAGRALAPRAADRDDFFRDMLYFESATAPRSRSNGDDEDD